MDLCAIYSYLGVSPRGRSLGRCPVQVRGHGPGANVGRCPVMANGPDVVQGRGRVMVNGHGHGPDLVQGRGRVMVNGHGPDLVQGRGRVMLNGDGHGLSCALCVSPCAFGKDRPKLGVPRDRDRFLLSYTLSL